jgi:hypothetical protein
MMCQHSASDAGAQGTHDVALKQKLLARTTIDLGNAAG